MIVSCHVFSSKLWLCLLVVFATFDLCIGVVKNRIYHPPLRIMQVVEPDPIKIANIEYRMNLLPNIFLAVAKLKDLLSKINMLIQVKQKWGFINYHPYTNKFQYTLDSIHSASHNYTNAECVSSLSQSG